MAKPIWLARQAYTSGGDGTIDAQLSSGSGTRKAHVANPAFIKDRTRWTWMAHRALCGARILAGDDGDVIQWFFYDETPSNACKKCLAKL